MALFDREFIACPDDKKDQMVFKHPDINIRKYSRAIVNADQIALFVNKGVVIGEIGPGQHKLDADELPFLGAIIDNVVARNMYRAELYYVSTREFVDERFGGRIDDVQDPQTGLFVSLRVFGEYALRLTKPNLVVTKLVGTVNVDDNESITDWVDQLLLKTMKTDVTRNIVRLGWPIMGLSAFIPEIEKSAIDATNADLADYGLQLTRMGNFDINLSDEDMKTLKGLAKDTAYTRLAGSYTAVAQADMLKGMGAGAAEHGLGGAGAIIAGIGMGQMMPGAPAPATAPPPPPAPGFAGGGAGFTAGPAAGAMTCASCSTVNAPSAKFCANCGTPTAPPTVACAACNAENAQVAKFCANCGSSMAPKVLKCTNCATELVPGAKFCASCGTPAAM